MSPPNDRPSVHRSAQPPLLEGALEGDLGDMEYPAEEEGTWESSSIKILKNLPLKMAF